MEAKTASQLKVPTKGVSHVSARLAVVPLVSSLLFGYNVAAFNTAKSYVILDFAWCAGEAESLSCKTGTYYSMLIGSSIFLSALLGCILAKGVVELGRKLALKVNFAIYMLGAILCGISEGFKTLMLGRLLIGIGVGFSTVCPPRFIAEIATKEKRGFYGTLHQLFIVQGLLLAGLMGLVFGEEPLNTATDTISVLQSTWWRVMLALPALISILGLFLLTYVFPYETPFAYYKFGQKLDACKLLSSIVSNGTYIPNSLPSEEDTSPCATAYRELCDSCNQEGSQEQLSLLEVVKSKPYLKVLMIGVVLAAGQQFSGINALMANSNSLYRSINLSTKAITIVSVCMYVLNLLMTFPALWLVDTMGRKTLLILGNSLQAVFLLAGAASLIFAPQAKFSAYMGIVATYGYVVAFASAYGPVLWVYLFECFPGNMHYVGPAVGSAVSWASAFIVVMATDFILLLGSGYVFLIFGVASILVAIFVALAVKETRNLPLGHSPYFPAHSTLVRKEP